MFNFNYEVRMTTLSDLGMRDDFDLGYHSNMAAALTTMAKEIEALEKHDSDEIVKCSVYLIGAEGREILRHWVK